MKRAVVMVLGALLVLSMSTFVQAEAAKAAPAKAAAGKATMWAAEELKWVDVPGFPVKTTVLSGDATKPGEHIALHKFGAGFAAPMHHHTADHEVVVVSGTVIMGPEGEPEKKLGPGSFFSFHGKKKHTTKCAEGADCILAVTSHGAWDVLVDEPAKK